MSLGIVVDVMIGLAFSYLLLAIMASGIQEMVAGWLKWRGKDLRNGLLSLLKGTDKTGAPLTGLFETVFNHSLVSDLSKKGLPSYVPARNFSLALFEALKDGGSGTLFTKIQQGVAALPEGSAKQALSAFISETAGDVDALQKRVETWFDDAMDRVSGEYRRFSQGIAVLFGFGLAVVLNVDSIALARALWSDPALRNSMVAAAQQYVDQNKDAPAKAEELDKLRCRLVGLKLPIGWTDTETNLRRCENEAEANKAGQPLNEYLIAKAAKKVEQTPDEYKKAIAKEADEKRKSVAEVLESRPEYEGKGNQSALALFWKKLAKEDGGIWLFVGWLITAAAVAFGSPFWFDALKRLLNLRNAGPKPPRSDDAAGETR